MIIFAFPEFNEGIPLTLPEFNEGSHIIYVTCFCTHQNTPVVIVGVEYPCRPIRNLANIPPPQRIVIYLCTGCRGPVCHILDVTCPYY